MDDFGFLERFGPVFLDSFFVVDKDRRIQLINQPFAEMLGLRTGQKRAAIGKSCFELLNLDICKSGCIVLQCLAKNGPVRLEEVKGKTPDGRDLVLALSAIPLTGSDGKIAGVFVTHRDVTDERSLMTRYVDLQKQSKAKVDALLSIIQEREAELAKLRNK